MTITQIDNNFHKLVELTATRTFDILESHNNDVSKAHRKGIDILAQTYAEILFDIRTGRFAIPLPTGTGKTTTIVALSLALHRLKLDAGVMVCAEKVEALCELKRSLIEAGFPEEKIGLLHGYGHDPEFNRECPKPNTASEPSCSPHEVDDKQLLLVTHQRMKTEGLDLDSLGYQGNTRQLNIWDEGFISSDGWSLNIKSLEQEIGTWKSSYSHEARFEKKLSDQAEVLNGYLEQVDHCIVERLSGIRTGESRILTIDPIQLSEIEIKSALKEVLGSKSQKDSILNFLKNTGDSLRVIRTRQNDAFLKYEVIIPEELTNLVILDASYPIRELCKLDETIKEIETGFQKDYSPVEIHWMESRSGRGYIQEQAEKGQESVLFSEIVQIVQSTLNDHPDEGILLFTFKTREIEIIGELKRLLVESGIDVDATNNQDQKLINFLTWGMETSLNSYSHCRHVILGGILHLPVIDVAALAVGQKRNLKSEFVKGELESLLLHEQAHCVYQAMSRGACRNTVEGKALPMKAYLFHTKLPEIQKALGHVMSGVQWKKYTPVYMKDGISKTDQLAMEMDKILIEYGDRGSSSTQLKKELEKRRGETIGSSIFRKAGDKLVNQPFGWERVGRSFGREMVIERDSQL
ncbi:MAG: hypothetical protein RPU34_02475 [Candidatus Sedimenticola sp. (ex Thyasira tokunagai)]